MGGGTKSDELSTMLEERKSVHGDFREQFACAQALKNVAFTFQQEKMTDVQREAFDMIIHKLSRIITGNPSFKDHWVDLAGYAALIAGTLK